MIQLRWLVDPNEVYTYKEPVLQYRQLLGRIDASGAWNVIPPEWSEWEDVPRVEAKK